MGLVYKSIKMSNLLPLKKIADEKSIFKYKWQEVIYRNYGRMLKEKLKKDSGLTVILN